MALVMGEVGREPHLDHMLGIVSCKEPCTEGEDGRIVMLT